MFDPWLYPLAGLHLHPLTGIESDHDTKNLKDILFRLQNNLLSITIWKDPSIRTAKLFWDSYTFEKEFNYADYPDGVVQAVIDGLEDRSYTFEIVNFDEAGNKSLATELTTAPFGESWLVSHAERSVTSAKMDGEDAVILMTKSTDEMTATHFRYKNAAGQWIEGPTMLPADREIRLPGAQKGKYFEYRSSYKPADGMDEVASVSWTKSPEPILYPLDTKGWKVSVTTDQEYSSYTADKIFDGIASSSNRWHSARSGAAAKAFPKILSIDTAAEEGQESTLPLHTLTSCREFRQTHLRRDNKPE